MRNFATATLFLAFIPSHADAKQAAAPKFVAGAVNSAVAATIVRDADKPRAIGDTTREPEAGVTGRPETEADRVESPPADDFDLVCQTLQSAALRNDLPVSFLTRLIWQESRFDGHAISLAGARGVAQFMPETAAQLGLANPFDVSDSINKSAEFLRGLKEQFGNLGLAAAAYNAGPKRVQDWLAGGSRLPTETEAYVWIITGHAANDWRFAQPNPWSLTLPEALPCPQLIKLLADKPESISPKDKPASGPVAAPVEPVWAVQLIGDPSQAAALTRYHELQKAYKSILGGIQPLVLAYKAGRSVYWYQVRVAAGNFVQAQRLCTGLRAAGRSCLVEVTDGRLLKKEGF